MDVAIPLDKLVVITNVSGSGKSSSALDPSCPGSVLLCRISNDLCSPVPAQDGKAGVDYIDGLSLAISVD